MSLVEGDTPTSSSLSVSISIPKRAKLQEITTSMADSSAPVVGSSALDYKRPRKIRSAKRATSSQVTTSVELEEFAHTKAEPRLGRLPADGHIPSHVTAEMVESSEEGFLLAKNVPSKRWDKFLKKQDGRMLRYMDYDDNGGKVWIFELPSLAHDCVASAFMHANRWNVQPTLLNSMCREIAFPAFKMIPDIAWTPMAWAMNVPQDAIGAELPNMIMEVLVSQSVAKCKIKFNTIFTLDIPYAVMVRVKEFAQAQGAVPHYEYYLDLQLFERANWLQQMAQNFMTPKNVLPVAHFCFGDRLRNGNRNPRAAVAADMYMLSLDANLLLRGSNPPAQGIVQIDLFDVKDYLGLIRK